MRRLTHIAALAARRGLIRLVTIVIVALHEVRKFARQ